MDISKRRASTSRHQSKQVRRKMGCNSSATVGLQQPERRQTNSSRPEIGKSIYRLIMTEPFLISTRRHVS